jgi:hypothetical protein
MHLRTSQLEEMDLSQNTQQTGIQMVSILVTSIKITKEIMVTVLQLWEDHHTAQEFNTEVLAIRKGHQDLVTYSIQRPSQVTHGGNYQTLTKDSKELDLKIIGVPLIPT